MFSPAANVNGAVVHLAGAHSTVAAGNIPRASLLAKASAPTSVVDGDVMSSTDTGGLITGAGWGEHRLRNAVFIPAGKGLYFISTDAESGGLRHALYTLL